MVTKKQIWNTLDQFEGKPRGSSYSNLQKERKRQGYSKRKPGNQESLLSAMRRGNEKKVRKLERKVAQGKRIWLI